MKLHQRIIKKKSTNRWVNKYCNFPISIEYLKLNKEIGICMNFFCPPTRTSATIMIIKRKKKLVFNQKQAKPYFNKIDYHDLWRLKNFREDFFFLFLKLRDPNNNLFWSSMFVINTSPRQLVYVFVPSRV